MTAGQVQLIIAWWLPTGTRAGRGDTEELEIEQGAEQEEESPLEEMDEQRGSVHLM